jgi:hypothetical protein
MKDVILTYYSDEDILFIQFSNKKTPIGSNEFQEGVTIFRNPNDKKEIFSIEIVDFSHFVGDELEVEKTRKINFASVFKKVRMFHSLRDIIGTEEFEETLKMWGFKKVENKSPKNIHAIDYKVKQSELTSFAY